MNVSDAKEALKNLARYHALGITLKRKRPEFFKKVIALAEVISGDFDWLIQGLETTLKDIREEFSSFKHLHSIGSIFQNVLNSVRSANGTLKMIPEEPWATITHGDFHVNNILFHRDENGKVDDVKFVDFHMYLYYSSLKDLPYFICGSLDNSAATNHIDKLLETFVIALERMGCDTTLFTRDAFDQELN